LKIGDNSVRTLAYCLRWQPTGLADHPIAGLIAGGKDGSNEFQIALLLIDSK
jgi:hypothetical protein